MSARGSRLGIAAGLLAVILAPFSGAAQSVSERMQSVGDAQVRMQYGARPGVCSSGDNVRMVRSDRTSADWEPSCEGFQVHLMATVAGGRVTDIETHVGGAWRSNAGAVDFGAVGVNDVVPWLLTLASTYHDDVAPDALGAAALADSVDLVTDLVRLVRDRDRPHAVRRAAVFWLGDSGREVAIPVLEDVVREARYSDLAETGIFALAHHGSNAAAQVVKSVALDRGVSIDLRQNAIFWLGQGGIRDVEFLQSLFYDIEGRELRERIVFAVAQGSDAAAAEWLIGLVDDETISMGLRRHALFWLGQNASVEELDSLYGRMLEPELREHVIFVISQKRNDVAAIETLIRIAEDDHDYEMQKKAIFWLGQFDDARAAEFLARLINGEF